MKGHIDERKPLRLLVVEDNGAYLESLERLLTVSGFSVTPAFGLDGAIHAMDTEGRHDAALIDYELGGGDTGLMVVDELRRRYRPPTPAILMTGLMTGRTSPAIPGLAAIDGVTVLDKLFSPPKLLDLITELCAAPDPSAAARQ